MVQGSAADLIKVAMVRVDSRCRAELPRWRRPRMVNMLHDELVYEVPAESVPRVRRIVRECMERPVSDFSVALVMQIKKGPIWGAMKKVK